ncbi:MAG: hypothetical protein PVG91_09870 [Gammaproteobacteria bacterium]
MATDQRPRSLADIAQGRTRDARRDDDRKSVDAGAPLAVGWGAYGGVSGDGDAAGSRHQGARKLYTLKAYKAWAARVRANWDGESGS